MKSYLKSVYRFITSRKSRPGRRMLNQALLKEKEALKVVWKNFPRLVEMGYQLCSLRAQSWTPSLGMTEACTNRFEDSSTRPKPHCGRLPQCATLISTLIFYYSKWTLALLQNSQKWLSISLSIKGRANTQPVLCILAFLHYLWGTLHALMIDLEDGNHMVSSLSVAANLPRMNKSMWSSRSILIMSGQRKWSAFSAIIFSTLLKFNPLLRSCVWHSWKLLPVLYWTHQEGW